MANSSVSPSSLDCTRGNGPPDFFQPSQAPEIVKDIQKISARFDTQFEVSKDDVVMTLGEAR